MSLLTLHVGSSLARAVLTILMTSYGYAATFVMSFTVCRLILFGSFLPIYLGKLSCNIIPTGVRNFPSLFSSQGRNRLIREAEEYRGRCESLAIAQCQGTYRFSESNLYRVSDCTTEIAICGATVRFMHQKPTLDGPAGCRRPIIFLHGNPSWSYMWRSILPHLLDQGHEVYALDWLGHGRSDKPTHPELVTFELHIHTLLQLFQVHNLRQATIMACTCLLLLNSFLPPRPDEWNLHYSLLYAIWYLSTGLLGGYMPESGVMRFMSPHLSQPEIDGYSAPYRSLPVATKANVLRFGHIVPVTPRFALHGLRQTRMWKLLEGLCGPPCLGKGNPDVAVVFGEQDPLLKLYKDILVDCIHPAHIVEWAPQGIWLSGGGYYPMEENAADISLLIEKLASR
ncbi:hypothetical protein ASPFODRAFT_83039 [Aspergillus luchuensis CBS 106.47]|uniref:AB hydrolase-1 domain-containing protein n=1 Tax=Aspergillus luchuensis (strain CBS 106.47) TaxID=1137211 RepID=A0A1M3TDM7_ASPLC|nr:hypothetical protein ASPFODRAFT_83039 [Aspergillus luchuensis CBS 106.47]